MYYRDHAPPHFHAIYGNDEAVVRIDSGEITDGRLPQRARTLVAEWTALHRGELQSNWDLARASQPLRKITPLD